MYQRAAGSRIEAFDRLIQHLCAEPVLVKRPGRADRLGAQKPGTAPDLFAFGDRRCGGIVDRSEHRV